MLGQAIDLRTNGTNDPHRRGWIISRDRQPDVFQIALRDW
jgi:hypothetical protein